MTKQTKWALGVLAFVVTETVARRVGQFEMKDAAENQLATLYQSIGCGGSMFDAILATSNGIAHCVQNREVKAYAKGVQDEKACANYDSKACAKISVRLEGE
jgi:hypothetical protein